VRLGCHVAFDPRYHGWPDRPRLEWRRCWCQFGVTSMGARHVVWNCRVPLGSRLHMWPATRQLLWNGSSYRTVMRASIDSPIIQDVTE
jgi:hypothetical protein